MRAALVAALSLAACFGEREPGQPVISAFKNQPVVIPGDQLTPQPEQATYRWSVREQPAGAEVALLEVESARPTFETNRSGSYLVEARIRTGLNELTAVVRVEVTNIAPAISAQSDELIVAVDSVGSLGIDVENADSDPLSVEVRTLASPPGAPESAAADTTGLSFFPEVEGDYVFELAVDDGEASASVVVEARATPRIEVLFTDAGGLLAHSRSLDTLVSFSDLKLHLYDVASASAVVVDGVSRALAMSLSPDGRSLAVGSANTSLVELETAQAEFVATGSAGELAYGPDSRLFFSASNGDVLSEYNLLTDELFPGPVGTFPIIHAVAVASGQPALYGARDGELVKWTTTTSPPSVTASLAVEHCDEIWVADDGSLLVDGTGTVYGLSADPAQDLVAQGALEGTSPPACALQHVDIASAAGIAAVILTAQPDRVLIYELQTRALAQTIPLPEVPPNPPVELAASAVFLSADGSRYLLALDYNGRLGVIARPLPVSSSARPSP